MDWYEIGINAKYDCTNYKTSATTTKWKLVTSEEKGPVRSLMANIFHKIHI